LRGGLDLSFLDDRIGVSATYYWRTTDDQIGVIIVPESTGFENSVSNFGNVSNEGVELSLDLTPVKTLWGFNWNIYTTFTHNKNVVEELNVQGTRFQANPSTRSLTELESDLKEIQLGPAFAGEVRTVLREGEEFGLLLGTVAARDDEGNLLIDPFFGTLIPADELDIIGNPNPDFLMGFTNTFSWKGLELRAVFDWRQGGDLYSENVSAILGRGVLAFQADREAPRIITGVYGDPATREPLRDESGNKIPNQTAIPTNRLYFGNSFALIGAHEWSVWDATTIRLREVALTYVLPKSLLETTPFGNVTIGFTGRNLWYNAPNFPKDVNFDPEVSQFGADSNSQGIDYSTYPSSRRFAFNLKVSF